MVVVVGTSFERFHQQLLGSHGALYRAGHTLIGHPKGQTLAIILTP